MSWTGPNREDSAKFMGRIGGLLVLWFMVAMVGFTRQSLFWLAVVGLLLFIGTGVFGAIKAGEHLSLQGGRVGPVTSEPGRVRLGRRRPSRGRRAATRRRWPGSRGGNRRDSHDNR